MEIDIGIIAVKYTYYHDSESISIGSLTLRNVRLLMFLRVRDPKKSTFTTIIEKSNITLIMIVNVIS